MLMSSHHNQSHVSFYHCIPPLDYMQHRESSSAWRQLLGNWQKKWWRYARTVTQALLLTIIMNRHSCLYVHGVSPTALLNALLIYFSFILVLQGHGWSSIFIFHWLQSTLQIGPNWSTQALRGSGHHDGDHDLQEQLPSIQVISSVNLFLSVCQSVTAWNHITADILVNRLPRQVPFDHVRTCHSL